MNHDFSGQNLTKSYNVSLYGRFGYTVTFLAGIPFCGSIFLPVISFKTSSIGAGILIFMMGIGSCWLMIYSASQLFRTTPRFLLDENGFLYRGLLLRRYFRWSEILPPKLDYSSQMGFVFLVINLKSGPRWRRFRRLDVSGLAPNYKILLKEMNHYLLYTHAGTDTAQI